MGLSHRFSLLTHYPTRSSYFLHASSHRRRRCSLCSQGKQNRTFKKSKRNKWLLIAFTTLPRLPQVLSITICRQKRFIFILLWQPLQILDTDKQNGTRKSCCFSLRCCRRMCSVTDRKGDKSQFTTLRIFTKTLRSGNNTTEVHDHRGASLGAAS